MAVFCLAEFSLFYFDRSIVTLHRRASVTPPSPPLDFVLIVFPPCEYRISSLNFFVTVRLWEPYERNEKINIGGHHARFGDKLCRDHAIFPNLVIVAVVGSFTFEEKLKPFENWKKYAVIKFNLNIITVENLSR